jgi:ketosteroid isomerase-like protein
MKRMHKRIVLTLLAFLVAVLLTKVACADDHEDRAGIERLHEQDIAATVSDNADQLTKLWDEDAVRLQSGLSPEIGKAAIYDSDKQWQSNRRGGHTLSYKPEIKDLHIANGWAFEWGTFEVHYRAWEGGKEKILSGKMLRVLKKQSDGSWKFFRVMASIDSQKK